MKKILIFSSKHGNTLKVSKLFEDNFETFNVKANPSIENYDFVFFLSPTYGDEELPLDLEDYLINIKDKKKLFTVCELGNYFGYDEFSWGAAKIIYNFCIKKLNWHLFYPINSVDSFYNIDFPKILTWKDQLYNALKHKS